MGFFDDEDDDLGAALNEDADVCPHGNERGREFCRQCEEQFEQADDDDREDDIEDDRDAQAEAAEDAERAKDYFNDGGRG